MYAKCGYPSRCAITLFLHSVRDGGANLRLINTTIIQNIPGDPPTSEIKLLGLQCHFPCRKTGVDLSNKETWIMCQSIFDGPLTKLMISIDVPP